MRRRLLAVQHLTGALGRLLENGVMLAAGVLLLFLSVVLFLQVLFRYVLLQPLPWSEEAARFGMVWFGMLTAVVAARRGLHFIFRWGTLVLPASVRRWLRQAVNLLVIAFLSFAFVHSLTYLDIVANQTAQATRLNMRIPFAGVTVGAAALIVVYVFEVLDALLGIVTGQHLSERELQEASVYALLTHSPASPASADVDPAVRSSEKA
jgi:TRAP-type C4-dicarboxylate transport system permease small subunit